MDGIRYTEKERQEEVTISRDALLDAHRKIKGAFTELGIALRAINQMLDTTKEKW